MWCISLCATVVLFFAGLLYFCHKSLVVNELPQGSGVKCCPGSCVTFDRRELQAGRHLKKLVYHGVHRGRDNAYSVGGPVFFVYCERASSILMKSVVYLSMSSD